VENKLLELNETIEKEIDLQKTLLKIAQKQTDMLIKNSHDGISKTAQSAEQVMLKIKKLEQKNKLTLNAVFNEQDNNITSLLIDKTIEKKFRDDIGKKLAQMADIIRKLTLTNYRNALLIKQLMDVQSFETKILTEKLDETVIYGNKGRKNQTNDNLFLDQQI
jgi:hypothetical protein